MHVQVRKAVLSDTLGWEYNISVERSWTEAIVRTRLGECDIGWGPFYVLGSRERCNSNPQTCRPVSEIDFSQDLSAFACCVDFSANYLPYRIMLMAPVSSKRSFFNALFDALGDKFVINFICFTFIFIVIGGHLMWFVERNANDANFPKAYTDGVDDGIWWAMVTATTVGYGDKVPITPAGRLLAMAFMIVGIALFSVLSGHISASLLDSRDSHLAAARAATVLSLVGKRVCGYPYVLDTLLQNIRFSKKYAQLIEECGAMLKAGEVRSCRTRTRADMRMRDVHQLTCIDYAVFRGRVHRWT